MLHGQKCGLCGLVLVLEYLPSIAECLATRALVRSLPMLSNKTQPVFLFVSPHFMFNSSTFKSSSLCSMDVLYGAQWEVSCWNTIRASSDCDQKDGCKQFSKMSLYAASFTRIKDPGQTAPV